MNEKPHSIFPGKSKEEIENIEKELNNVSMGRDDDFVEEKNIHDVIHLHKNTEPLNDVAVETIEKVDEELDSIIEKANIQLSELKVKKKQLEIKYGIFDANLLKIEDELDNLFKKSFQKNLTKNNEGEVERKIDEIEIKMKEVTKEIEKIDAEIEIITNKTDSIIKIFEPSNPNLN